MSKPIKGFLYNSPMLVDSCELLMYRLQQTRHHNSYLISVSGGIGDRICAEPAIRWLKNNTDKEIIVASKNPEFFTHLNVKNLSPDDDYDFYTNNVLVSMWHGQAAATSFYHVLTIHPVDYTSLSLIQSILPVKDKVLKTRFEQPNNQELLELLKNPIIAIHPGITWPTRTIPYSYWRKLLTAIQPLRDKYKIVIVGKQDPAIKQGVYEDLAKEFDLVNLVDRLTIPELGYFLTRVDTLITNDSSPLHLASVEGSRTKIAYYSVAKRSDFLNHYRVNDDNEVEFGWRMKNFAVEKAEYVNVFFDPLKRFTHKPDEFMTPDQIRECLPNNFDELLEWIKMP